MIFFDDVDSITTNRDADDGDEVGGRILSTLLNEMDGVDTAVGGVIFIGTTSKPLKDIDSALLRPGRLSAQIEIEKPSAASLLEIMTGIMMEADGDGYDSILKVEVSARKG